ncbi:class F sortase [Nakamurella sp. GG22]
MAVLIGCAGTPAPDNARGVDVTTAAAAQPAASSPSTASVAPTRAASESPSPTAPKPSSTPTSAPAKAPAKAPSKAPPKAPSIAGAVQPAPNALILPPSPPVALSVPAIGVDAALIDLGRTPDGAIEVPSLDDPDSKPGWYENSPAPGSLGPAIILGHVDSREFGPGVFFLLNQLKPGDSIDVTRNDGTAAIFTVDTVQTVEKKDFPTSEVYGNLDHAGLRLITCGGEFDENARSYESNIIVFASLAGSRST